MNIKASGRSALIIAAGFWVCVSGPLQAAEDADGGVAAYRTETAAGPPVALSENGDEKDKAPSATLAMAVAQAAPQSQAAAVSNDDSAWSQTSLIGKMFIAFGGLLTLASAARMFMA